MAKPVRISGKLVLKRNVLPNIQAGEARAGPNPPLRGTQACCGPRSSPDASSGEFRPGHPPVLPQSESREYELVATISHIGTGTASGHYNAAVLTPEGQWVRNLPVASSLARPSGWRALLSPGAPHCPPPPQVVCDDGRIRPTRAGEVFSDENAYLLIFERKERAGAAGESGRSR